MEVVLEPVLVQVLETIEVFLEYTQVLRGLVDLPLDEGDVGQFQNTLQHDVLDVYVHLGVLALETVLDVQHYLGQYAGGLLVVVGQFLLGGVVVGQQL